ncbi:hypothetical protein E2C01_045737 [Portunus trituberculatus]|uniref:Uncharacterized protein n=1 Tax=Portunus trituberculatus TaxID=210409 RepID=A0A5B7FVX5_PORTR|nr:hypothetical protein [Portunus trituberculatus]
MWLGVSSTGAAAPVVACPLLTSGFFLTPTRSVDMLTIPHSAIIPWKEKIQSMLCLGNNDGEVIKKEGFDDMLTIPRSAI